MKKQPVIKREQSTRGAGFNHTFGYDSAGNPTTFKGTSQSFNTNNQQTGAGFSHDADGNPTTYKGTSLSFDSENRLTAYGSQTTASRCGDGPRLFKLSDISPPDEETPPSAFPRQKSA